MALTPEDLDSRIAGQADDYLFVLDALRWCMPRNNIVGWDAYLSGDVSRSKVPATVENIGAMVLCLMEDGSVDSRKLTQFAEETALDPAAAAIINAYVADSPIVHSSTA